MIFMMTMIFSNHANHFNHKNHSSISSLHQLHLFLRQPIQLVCKLIDLVLEKDFLGGGLLAASCW
ncbi:MAG: hypothetical protein A2136_01125 [Chloroflexi bacterium RBG_16_54_11]|nr:MAG: hypothetical protein A2136_01125 [Chloroflexi bacterium RBG_16_54_11]